jgi:hypothetical protein
MSFNASTPRALSQFDARSLTAAGLCLGSAFFDTLGWPLAIVGVVLLRRSVFGTKARATLTAMALVPKLLFAAAHWLRAPRGVSFTVEGSTLATSPSLWGYCALLMGFGVLAFVQKLPDASSATTAPTGPLAKSTIPLKCLGVVAVALGAGMLTGLLDGFHRIDDLGNGRWVLTHAARGSLATFTRTELLGIDATESYARRGPNSYHIVVTLTGGRTYSQTTTFIGVMQELRDLATTADLAPGVVRIRPHRGKPWTNGASGFGQKDFIGKYDYTDAPTAERSTFEFLTRGECLEGMKTDFVGSKALNQKLSNIRLSDTGKAEFELATVLEQGAPSKTSKSFSLRWSPTRQSAQLTNVGLEVGSAHYTRR